MYMQRKYRLASHIGGVRKKLAKMIVAEFDKLGIKARCEPKHLAPAYGHWRQIEQDVMSWEGHCKVKMADGKWSARSLGSWDRMSSCVKGLTISGDGFGYEVCAIHELPPAKRFGIIKRAQR
jgi:hypothetical protein